VVAKLGFSGNRMLGAYVAESARRHIHRLMIAWQPWQPWQPAPSSLGVQAQAAPQLCYRNIDIARGAQDRYILRFGRSIVAFPGDHLPALRARYERLTGRSRPGQTGSRRGRPGRRR
jgi:hypothetical protein